MRRSVRDSYLDCCSSKRGSGSLVSRACAPVAGTALQHRRRRRPSPPGARQAHQSVGRQQDPHRRARRLGPSLGPRHPLPRLPRRDPPHHLHNQQRREPAHASPQDDQDTRTLSQRRRSAPTDLARDHARQNDVAPALAIDGSASGTRRQPETTMCRRNGRLGHRRRGPPLAQPLQPDTTPQLNSETNPESAAFTTSVAGASS